MFIKTLKPIQFGVAEELFKKTDFMAYTTHSKFHALQK